MVLAQERFKCFPSRQADCNHSRHALRSGIEGKLAGSGLHQGKTILFPCRTGCACVLDGELNLSNTTGTTMSVVQDAGVILILILSDIVTCFLGSRVDVTKVCSDPVPERILSADFSTAVGACREHTCYCTTCMRRPRDVLCLWSESVIGYLG